MPKKTAAGEEIRNIKAHIYREVVCKFVTFAENEKI